MKEFLGGAGAGNILEALLSLLDAARNSTQRLWKRGRPMPPKITPPFTEETARAKVQAAEDAWNSCEPDRVALAYTVDSEWRNRDQFFSGREAIKEFLRRKWAKELDYRLKKELWAYTGNRISVRFEYEWRDAGSGQGGRRPPRLLSRVAGCPPQHPSPAGCVALRMRG